MAIIKLASIGIGVYTIFSFGKRILPEYNTRDIELSNTMAQPMTSKCCVQQGFPSKPLA